MFDWSADSRQLALVPEGELHQIIIVDVSSPHPVRRIATNTPGKVLDVAWHPRKNMLILLEQKDGSRYFIDYDYTKETEHILFSRNSDLRSPAWLPPGQGYIFQWYRHGVGKLFIGSEQAGGEPRRLPPDGTSVFLGLLPGGKAIAVTHRGEGSVQILKVSLQKSAPEVLATAHISALGAVKPKQIYVKSFDGTRVPILVWRSPSSKPRSRAVVVRVHADLHSAETPLWQEDIQMYLKHGVDFIAVNYRGSPGYGTDFEKAGDSEKRSRDVVAACEYAHSVLSIPYDRIALFGHSNGATIALGAALLQPLHVGVLVLVSLPGLPQGWHTYAGARGRPLVVLALHGEKDQILPSALARSLIEKVFGSDVLIPVSEHWQIIPNEDHVLHLESSWAFVHSTVLRQLNPNSCGR
jgi:dipeptidyl aminopeptidase/acylaminoacyl peptidase